MTPVAVTVTRHAKKRVHQRLGLPSRAVVRAAARALRAGLSSREVGKELRITSTPRLARTLRFSGSTGALSSRLPSSATPHRSSPLGP
ncbi:hypothetical protein [Caulobacter sp. FWC2]|uniref:hypothetical protein n=1 Tax=Caulobacter sp. FWC2 TaxID=69664 RepID=UPI001178C2CB|nr:hypothetical protein [Caulobacter sp. FWC2]